MPSTAAVGASLAAATLCSKTLDSPVQAFCADLNSFQGL